MKFVCERCHTRYSIADDKVRQKIHKAKEKSSEEEEKKKKKTEESTTS